MTKEELKFLMTKGFTVSELLELEQGAPAAPAADPAPEPKPEPEAPAAPEAKKPEEKNPEEKKPEKAADPAPADHSEEIASLKAQIAALQAQVLNQTTQPGQAQKSIEDLVAAF